MNTEHTHYHEEAETVAWSDIMVNGWKISVTARQGATSADIITNVLALGDALKTLREKYNATPYLNGNGPKAANAALTAATHAPTSDEEFNNLPSASAQRAQAAQAAQPAPVTMQAPTLANGAEDPGYCKTHRVAMKRHEKNGEVWYSHKAPDGSWCRGKYNPPSLGY
jgi:hypothetical protein